GTAATRRTRAGTRPSDRAGDRAFPWAQILLPDGSATVLEGQVFGRAHLDQARGSALEGAGQALAGVQPGRRRVRAAHQVDVAVVELVDQGDEAARGVVAAR